MKYIDNPQLSKLSHALSHQSPECTVHTRIEAYSCKSIKRDKRLIKTLETTYADDVAHSPPGPAWLADDTEGEMTPFGPIESHSSRRTLYLLIATLNIAFPDYEFSKVRPSHFAREKSGANVLNSLSTTLIAHTSSTSKPGTFYAYPPTSPDLFPESLPSSSPFEQVLRSPHAPPPIVSGTHPSLYRTIDDAIGLGDCEVYSYNPDIESDPNASDLDDDDEYASDGDESPNDSDGERPVFEFDDYDIDEVALPSGSPGSPNSPLHSTSPLSFNRHLSQSRRRGALLWSSHWFFLNRKLKRILFVSVWARGSGAGRMWDASDMYEATKESSIRGERFFGWEGGVGAGARALGLVA